MENHLLYVRDIKFQQPEHGSGSKLITSVFKLDVGIVKVIISKVFFNVRKSRLLTEVTQ